MAVRKLLDLFPEKVQAVYTDRVAGGSLSPYQSYNLGQHVGDEPLLVAQNRSDFSRQMQADPCWLNQIHSTQVVDAASPDALESRADASFCRVPGKACVVMTADCLPVLLSDNSGSVVAAAHAGWRGLVDGVIENTVAAMSCDPESLIAWLGPCIGPNKFQVGAEVCDAFVQCDPNAEKAFVADGERFLADLHQLARQRLTRLGVKAIYGCEDCTYSLSEQYFSYRRDGVTGRMAAAIWLESKAPR